MADIAHQLKGGSEAPLQIGEEAPNRRCGGSLEKAPHGDVDRVHRPAADHFHDPAADGLEAQAAFHEFGPVDSKRKTAFVAEEIGGMEEVDMEGVALDPFPPVEQPAQGSDGRGDLHAKRIFQSLAGGELVGDRADAADPGRDVGHLGKGAAAEETFEEPGRLVDIEFGDLDPSIPHADAQGSLALHSRKRLHADAAELAHGWSPLSLSPSARNAGASAVNDRSMRPSCSGGIPCCW